MNYNAKAFSGFLETVPKLGDLRILEILGEYDGANYYNSWTGLNVLVYNEKSEQFSKKNVGLDKKTKEFFFMDSQAKIKKVKLPLRDWFPEAFV